MSPFRVMWIVSVEINRSVCRHAQTVRRSLPDAPDASTRAFTLQSQADANRSRPLRTHPDVVWVYRTNPTQWTQCVHGQPDANRSRTIRASGKLVSVYTALDRCFIKIVMIQNKPHARIVIWQIRTRSPEVSRVAVMSWLDDLLEESI